MSRMGLQLGKRVRLVSFKGRSAAPSKGIDPTDNYWALIGSVGTIISDVPPPGIDSMQVLVRFDEDLDSFKLANHNEVKNALWIFRSDLQES